MVVVVSRYFGVIHEHKHIHLKHSHMYIYLPKLTACRRRCSRRACRGTGAGPRSSPPLCTTINHHAQNNTNQENVCVSVCAVSEAD